MLAINKNKSRPLVKVKTMATNNLNAVSGEFSKKVVYKDAAPPSHHPDT